MAKIRKNASIENGLMKVLKILNDTEIQESIGKSSSYIRKCSNPDLPQQIDHNDSFKLDQSCIKKGKAPPLFTSYEHMIAEVLDNSEDIENKDINEMLVKSTILHGKLTELVKDAKDPNRKKEQKFHPLKKEIDQAITELENKILKIRLKIDIKS